MILTQEQIQNLKDDMATVLAIHGLTAGYLVAEYRKDDSPTAKLNVTVVSAVQGASPSPFLEAMAKQTYAINKSVSRMEGPIINGN